MVWQIGSHEKQVQFCDEAQQEGGRKRIEVVALERKRAGKMRDRQGREYCKVYSMTTRLERFSTQRFKDLYVQQ